MKAPYRADLAPGGGAGTTAFVTSEDGWRLRVCHWPGGALGLVLLLQGRSEYAEKYAKVAAWLTAQGYGVLTLDWRGQGLSEHRAPDAMTGHVEDFAEYLRDLKATLAWAAGRGLPAPSYLLAHSMGGAIGLAALRQGLSVKAAAFSAPMWGLRLPGLLRPLAGALLAFGLWRGKGAERAPLTSAVSYVSATPFERNLLTGDAAEYAWLAAQLDGEPGFRLGGPSYAWVQAARVLCADLQAGALPDLPILTLLGQAERVVDAAVTRRLVARMPQGRLREVPGGRHELLMEGPALRESLLEEIHRFWQAV